MTRLHRALAALALLLAPLLAPAPADAAVVITFWSHEFGADFPHAFVTLRGVPDAGGPAVDVNYGFTARAVTPAILLGSVGSKLDIAKPRYVAGSDAQFSVTMTDGQYADVLALVREWGEGRVRYSLNRRNCVHFVREAARRLGLAGLDQPRLMKKPRSYLLAVEAANPGRVTRVNLRGDAYLSRLPPLAGPVDRAPVPAPVGDGPTTPSGARARTGGVRPPSSPRPPTGSPP